VRNRLDKDTCLSVASSTLSIPLAFANVAALKLLDRLICLDVISNMSGAAVRFKASLVKQSTEVIATYETQQEHVRNNAVQRRTRDTRGRIATSLFASASFTRLNAM
jgi:hypothetical protein